jgi:phasin
MAYRTDDMFSFSAFNPSKLTDTLREMVEKNAVQSRDVFGKLKSAAEDATKTLETTLHTAQAGSVEFGLKAIDAMRTNVDLSMAHMQAILGVRSVAELVELQAGFLRRQTETTVEQAKLMQDTARKVAEEVARPGREAAEKAMSTFKQR